METTAIVKGARLSAQKGRLVAMVHFNKDELQQACRHMQEQASEYVEKKIKELTRELQQYVNARVNRFSRIQQVIAHAEPFQRTATKKIKRFLYT